MSLLVLINGNMILFFIVRKNGIAQVAMPLKLIVFSTLSAVYSA